MQILVVSAAVYDRNAFSMAGGDDYSTCKIQSFKSNGRRGKFYRFARNLAVIGSHKECDIILRNGDFPEFCALVVYDKGRVSIRATCSGIISIPSSQTTLVKSQSHALDIGDRFFIASKLFGIENFHEYVNTAEKTLAATHVADGKIRRSVIKSESRKRKGTRRSLLINEDGEEFVKASPRKFLPESTSPERISAHFRNELSPHQLSPPSRTPQRTSVGGMDINLSYASGDGPHVKNTRPKHEEFIQNVSINVATVHVPQVLAPIQLSANKRQSAKQSNVDGCGKSTLRHEASDDKYTRMMKGLPATPRTPAAVIRKQCLGKLASPEDGSCKIADKENTPQQTNDSDGKSKTKSGFESPLTAGRRVAPKPYLQQRRSASLLRPRERATFSAARAKSLLPSPRKKGVNFSSTELGSGSHYSPYRIAKPKIFARYAPKKGQTRNGRTVPSPSPPSDNNAKKSAEDHIEGPPPDPSLAGLGRFFYRSSQLPMDSRAAQGLQMQEESPQRKSREYSDDQTPWISGGAGSSGEADVSSSASGFSGLLKRLSGKFADTSPNKTPTRKPEEDDTPSELSIDVEEEELSEELNGSATTEGDQQSSEEKGFFARIFGRSSSSENSKISSDQTAGPCSADTAASAEEESAAESEDAGSLSDSSDRYESESVSGEEQCIRGSIFEYSSTGSVSVEEPAVSSSLASEASDDVSVGSNAEVEEQVKTANELDGSSEKLTPRNVRLSSKGSAGRSSPERLSSRIWRRLSSLGSAKKEDATNSGSAGDGDGLPLWTLGSSSGVENQSEGDADGIDGTSASDDVFRSNNVPGEKKRVSLGAREDLSISDGPCDQSLSEETSTNTSGITSEGRSPSDNPESEINPSTDRGSKDGSECDVPESGTDRSVVAEGSGLPPRRRSFRDSILAVAHTYLPPFYGSLSGNVEHFDSDSKQIAAPLEVGREPGRDLKESGERIITADAAEVDDDDTREEDTTQMAKGQSPLFSKEEKEDDVGAQSDNHYLEIESETVVGEPKEEHENVIRNDSSLKRVAMIVEKDDVIPQNLNIVGSEEGAELVYNIAAVTASELKSCLSEFNQSNIGLKAELFEKLTQTLSTVHEAKQFLSLSDESLRVCLKAISQPSGGDRYSAIQRIVDCVHPQQPSPLNGSDDDNEISDETSSEMRQVLRKRTVADLRKLASASKIDIPKKSRKAEIIELLVAHGDGVQDLKFDGDAIKCDVVVGDNSAPTLLPIPKSARKASRKNLKQSPAASPETERKKKNNKPLQQPVSTGTGDSCMEVIDLMEEEPVSEQPSQRSARKTRRKAMTQNGSGKSTGETRNMRVKESKIADLVHPETPERIEESNFQDCIESLEEAPKKRATRAKRRNVRSRGKATAGFAIDDGCEEVKAIPFSEATSSNADVAPDEEESTRTRVIRSKRGNKSAKETSSTPTAEIAEEERKAPKKRVTRVKRGNTPSAASAEVRKDTSEENGRVEEKERLPKRVTRSKRANTPSVASTEFTKDTPRRSGRVRKT